MGDVAQLALLACLCESTIRRTATTIMLMTRQQAAAVWVVKAAVQAAAVWVVKAAVND